MVSVHEIGLSNYIVQISRRDNVENLQGAPLDKTERNANRRGSRIFIANAGWGSISLPSCSRANLIFAQKREIVDVGPKNG